MIPSHQAKKVLNELFSKEYTEEDYHDPKLGLHLFEEIKYLNQRKVELYIYGVQGEMRNFCALGRLVQFINNR